jgi:hypothetical protein
MKRTLSRFTLLLAASLLLSLGAQAQLFRAYLASYGLDTNPCTVGAPCRLLPAAINAVAPGGEVWILDSANFNAGTVNITKSVSVLVVPGQIGSIAAVAGGPAITIAANASLGLRNVVIAGNVNNPGTHGINMSAGSAANVLSVEDCLFVNLPGTGIIVQNTPARVYVKNTVFRSSGDYALVAVNGPTVEITDSRMLGNAGGGVQAFGGADGTVTVVNVTDSTISGGAEGVYAIVNADAISSIMVTRSTIHDTGNALHAAGILAGHSMVVVTNSTVTNNATGVLQSGIVSVVKSLGNNYIGDNGGDVGSLTTAALR